MLHFDDGETESLLNTELVASGPLLYIDDVQSDNLSTVGLILQV